MMFSISTQVMLGKMAFFETISTIGSRNHHQNWTSFLNEFKHQGNNQEVEVETILPCHAVVIVVVPVLVCIPSSTQIILRSYFF